MPILHVAGWSPTTADRLARRGLPHPSCCPLCDQEEEDIQHLLVSCVVSRQFWFWLFHAVGVDALTTQHHEPCFMEWWRVTEGLVRDDLQQGLNFLIILGAWTIWKHSNEWVFNAASPNVSAASALARKGLNFGRWQELDLSPPLSLSLSASSLG